MTPPYARIFKETIISTIPSKPLPRTAKETIPVKRAIELYGSEIDLMYAHIHGALQNSTVAPPTSWSKSGVVVWIRAMLHELLVRPSALEDDEDIFNHGADR